MRLQIYDFSNTLAINFYKKVIFSSTVVLFEFHANNWEKNSNQYWLYSDAYFLLTTYCFHLIMNCILSFVSLTCKKPLKLCYLLISMQSHFPIEFLSPYNVQKMCHSNFLPYPSFRDRFFFELLYTLKFPLDIGKNNKNFIHIFSHRSRSFIPISFGICGCLY